MNNQNNSTQSFLRFIILTFIAYMMMQTFFNKPKPTDTPRPEKTAPSLELAFAGIAPLQKRSALSTQETPTPTPTATATSTPNGTATPTPIATPTPTATPIPAEQNARKGVAITAANAAQEIELLDKEIVANETDKFAQWALLRKGLIEQYVLGKMSTRERPRGAFDWLTGMFSPLPATQNAYERIIAHGGHDDITAQAHYQQGDLLWNESMKTAGRPSQQAANELMALLHRGRGSSEFAGFQVFVPRVEMNFKNGASTQKFIPRFIEPYKVPEGGFVPVKVSDLHGSLAQPFSYGIADRVDYQYSGGILYKIFDGTVNFFLKITGNNPHLAFGLAIITLAVLTRVAMQPFVKRQYDSMKGMQVIAPEMKKIQEKYKTKPPEQQAEMIREIRELQQRHGVNPMMGCGWGMLQMPLFLFIIWPMINHYQPKMDLAGAGFLWIPNLAHPDIPLLVLYGLTMFVSMRLSATPPSDPQQAQAQSLMTVFMLFMPLFLLSYPAALTLYWTISSAVSIVLQYKMLKNADPTKNFRKLLFSNPFAMAPADGPPVADSLPPRPRPKKERNPITLTIEKDDGEVMHRANRKNQPMNSDDNSLHEPIALTGEVAPMDSGENWNGSATNGNNGSAEGGSAEGGKIKPKTARRTVQRSRARRRH